MNDIHLKHNHSLYNQHKLRPLVIAVTAAIGISGLLAGCGGGGGGGNGGGNKGNGLVTSGGDAGKTTGFGGDGGEINLYAAAASTIIEILTSTKDAPDTSGIPDPDLGTAPLEITTDTTIPVELPADAADGEYFQVAGDCSIYQSNGDEVLDENDVTVTGVEIAKKVKLMLQDNLGSAGCITVANDLVNDGTIMPETEGGSLDLYMDNFFGSGPITTSGGDTNPDAGDISISADDSIYNEGSLSAAGADSKTGDGGNGGNINLYAYTNRMWNRGMLDTSGGDSTFDGGLGGNGGFVGLYAEVTNPAGGGSVISWGKIDSSGGDGNVGGGSGGNVDVGLDGPAFEEGAVDSNNIYVLAGIETTGGKVTGADGPGGTGGDIWMGINAAGGSLDILGLKNLTTTGGDGAEGGGDGGYVYFYSDGNDADYTNEAKVDTTGGNATASGIGGNGGYIELYNDGGTGSIDNSGDLTANGGSGVDGGGDGGDIYLYMYGDGIDTALSSVSNSGKLTSLGGDHTGASVEAYAGDGGYIEVEMDGHNGTVSNSGVINASGGKSNKGNAGDGGDVEVEMENVVDAGDPGNSVSNTASITTNGGVGGVDGGDGGSVDFYSPGVASTNSASISTQGGAGNTVNGGDGGYVLMYGEPVTNKGNINASGANGGVNGGDGGDIDLLSTGGTDTDNTGKLTSAGGSGGTLDGTPGVITIDTVVQ